MKRSDILRVVAVWGRRDDWNVEVIASRTLATLLAWLDAGVSVDDIVAHAGHVGRDCCALFEIARPEPGIEATR